MLSSLTLSLLQAVFERRLKETAMAMPLMCCGADMLAAPSRKQVVVVGRKPSHAFDRMLAAAHSSYNPNRTVSCSFSFFAPWKLCSVSKRVKLDAGDSY